MSEMGRRTGTVKWFDEQKGFGFITADVTDFFVHYRAIRRGVRDEGFRSLDDGATVEFTASRGPKGLIAEDVVQLS